MSKGSKGSKKRSSKFDPFIGSRSVEGLEPNNYEDFLTEKEISWVMYYNPEEPQCEWSKKHYLKAAKTTERENHGYGAVDCSREEDLCAKEGISTYPTFKLFVGKRPVETYTNPQMMTHIQIKKFIENMPPLSQAPPCSKEPPPKNEPSCNKKYKY